MRTYNRDPHPFQWVAIGSKIIRKVNNYKGTLETGDWFGGRLKILQLNNSDLNCFGAYSGYGPSSPAH